MVTCGMPLSANPAAPHVLLQANAKANFDESVEIALNLGVDPRRGDQTVRGTVVLPHGTGKSVRVAVFAEGEEADAARAAGEDESLSAGSTQCVQAWQAWTRTSKQAAAARAPPLWPH